MDARSVRSQIRTEKRNCGATRSGASRDLFGGKSAIILKDDYSFPAGFFLPEFSLILKIINHKYTPAFAPKYACCLQYDPKEKIIPEKLSENSKSY